MLRMGRFVLSLLVRIAQPLRMVVRCSSAAMAILVLAPVGAPHRITSTPGVSLCTQAANWIMPTHTLEPDTTPSFVVAPRPLDARTAPPQQEALYAANATRYHTLLTSRIGGRYGPS